MSVQMTPITPIADLTGSPVVANSVFRRMAAGLVIPALLAVITWMCHFTLSGRMGFYEDDYACAVPTMTWNWHRMQYAITTQVTAFPGWQGRAMGWILLSLLPWVGYRVGGVEGMYVIGFLVVWLNSVLLHRLLRRRFVEPLPILAAIGFIIFPADTTRSYLLHDHTLQVSLTFMLLAANLYLAGGVWRRIASYIVAGLCLITYESAILPFVVMPILDKKPSGWSWTRRLMTWAIHGAVLISIMGALAVARFVQAEQRVIDSTQNVSTLVKHVVNGLWLGPRAVMATYLRRALEGYSALGRGGFSFWSAAAMFAMVTLVGGWWLRRRRQPQSATTDAAEKEYLLRDLIPAFVYGAIAFPAAYLLSFTHYPPVATEGRETSVHLAAAIGAAILGATAATVIIRIACRVGLVWIGAGLIGLSSALLYSADLATQRGMVDVWRLQQCFWARVITLCPDLDRGTTIVCDGDMFQQDRSILANSWADTQVLQVLYEFPFYGVDVPELYSLPATGSGGPLEFRKAVIWENDNLLHWNEKAVGYPYLQNRPLYPGNTILLVTYDGVTYSRVSGTIDVNGRPLKLRDPDPLNDRLYPQSPLYRILLGKPAKR